MYDDRYDDNIEEAHKGATDFQNDGYLNIKHIHKIGNKQDHKGKYDLSVLNACFLLNLESLQQPDPKDKNIVTWK